MYEWVQTATGWRIFWGIDPCADQPELTPVAADLDVLTAEAAESRSPRSDGSSFSSPL